MPPDKRNRGRRQPPQTATARVTAGQLRRRRDGADRLAPLPSGHCDPLDALAGLPVPRACPCLGAEFTAGGVRPCCRDAA